MAMNADPILRHWHKDIETQQMFRVVALDESADSVELQYINGDVGEIDTEIWYESVFEPIEPPADWSAAYGAMEKEDLNYSDSDNHGPKNINLSDYIDD